MNDREVQVRLRRELERMVMAQNAPAQLLEHVGRLGEGDSTANREWRTSTARPSAATDDALPADRASRDPASFRPTRTRHASPGLMSLAATFAVVALLAGAVVWRTSRQAGSGPSATATGEPTRSAMTTQSAMPTPFATWSGAPARPVFGGRIGVDFGWIQTQNPGRIYATDDGGNTWRDITPAQLAGTWGNVVDGAASPSGPVGITFTDARHGYFYFVRPSAGSDSAGGPAYERSFFRTDDGGRTWTSSAFPAATTCVNTVDAWLDGQHGLVQCQPGTPAQRWTTSDGGASWRQVSGAEGAWPAQMKFETALDGWGFSSGGPAAASLLRTTDGGKTWNVAQLPISEMASFRFDQFPTTTDGRIVAGAEVGAAGDGSSWDFVTWVSADGGATWLADSTTHLGHGSDLDIGGHPNGWITFFDSDAWAIRLFDMSARSFVANFDVSGFCDAASGGSILGGWAASPRDAWASCRYSGSSTSLIYLYGTTDGGKTWRPLMGTP